jgi:hypothetical protein
VLRTGWMRQSDPSAPTADFLILGNIDPKTAGRMVELRGFETQLLPGEILSDLQVHSVSFQFSPGRYQRFRSRVLTASRVNPGRHIGRNLGSIPVILQVIYVDPIGKPLAEDAPNPGCDFG